MRIVAPYAGAADDDGTARASLVHRLAVAAGTVGTNGRRCAPVAGADRVDDRVVAGDRADDRGEIHPVPPVALNNVNLILCLPSLSCRDGTDGRGSRRHPKVEARVPSRRRTAPHDLARLSPARFDEMLQSLEVVLHALLERSGCDAVQMGERSRESGARDVCIEGEPASVAGGFDRVPITERRRTFAAFECHREVWRRLGDFNNVVCPAAWQRSRRRAPPRLGLHHCNAASWQKGGLARDALYHGEGSSDAASEFRMGPLRG